VGFRIDGQARIRELTRAVETEAAADIERQDDAVTLLDADDAGADLLTTPMFSCPKTSPGSTGALPSYMCKSLPKIALVVKRTIASPGSWIFGLSTWSTVTLRGSFQTTARTCTLQ